MGKLVLVSYCCCCCFHKFINYAQAKNEQQQQTVFKDFLQKKQTCHHTYNINLKQRVCHITVKNSTNNRYTITTATITTTTTTTKTTTTTSYHQQRILFNYVWCVKSAVVRLRGANKVLLQCLASI